MKKIELEPIDGRKSFYGKCYVVDNKLYSYNTLIMEFIPENKIVIPHCDFNLISSTTKRHINSFLNYFHLPKMSIQELKTFFS